ncbi:Histidine N-alpha-methyltransferase [Streptomyces californicus]
MSPFLLTRTLPEDATGAALRADVLTGLTRHPKSLPPKWFYDARGSEPFEEITRLPEYYPTRAEREILESRAAEIAAAALEPGPSSSWVRAPRRRPAICWTRSPSCTATSPWT